MCLQGGISLTVDSTPSSTTICTNYFNQSYNLFNKQMSSKIMLAIICMAILVYSVQSLHLAEDYQNIYLEGNQGYYLTACQNCPEKNLGTIRNVRYIKLKIFVGERQPRGAASRWNILKQEDGSVRVLNLESGKYLAWCASECKMGSAVSVISTDPNVANARFQLEQRNDGKWALKASNGNYIKFCNGCIDPGAINAQNAYVAMATGNANEDWAGFTIVNA